MSHTSVTQPSTNGTVRNVLAAALHNLNLRGVAEFGKPTRPNGPLPVMLALHVAAGYELPLVDAARAALTVAVPELVDCPVCEDACHQFTCWLATSPNRDQVTAVFNTAMGRLA